MLLNSSFVRRSFYRSANYIFGKVGRNASEEVILQLISSKCIFVLLYGLGESPLTTSDLSAIDCRKPFRYETFQN